MQQIYLKILGKPIAKKTHRTRTKAEVDWKTRQYKVKQWSYHPTSKEALQVQKILRDQYQNEPLNDPLFVHFVFHMPVPKSWTARQKNMALDGRLQPIGKPDASNLAKFYEDCMKGIIYTDDSRIIWVTPVKVYDDEGYTEIFITRFDREIYERFQRLVIERAS